MAIEEKLLRTFIRSKETLTESGYIVNPYREIQYGIQFLCFKGKLAGLVRIYLTKKGLRFDLSQVSSSELKRDLQERLMVKERPKVVPFNLKKQPGLQGDFTDIDELTGIDESGKGDYFGPLSVAAVYVESKTKKILQSLGVMDSKDLSDKYIQEIAPEIKSLCPHSLVVMGNKSYNEIYAKVKNLNHILAWGHARVLENVLSQVPCKYALSDQFGNPALVQNSLMSKGREIQLFQQHRAEAHIAVAAASILARNAFVTNLKKMEEAFEMSLPKGCSIETKRAAQAFVERYGIEKLELIAKLHFKLTEDLKT